VDEVAELPRPAGAVAEFLNTKVVLRSARKSKGQQDLDDQIHTVFGKTLAGKTLTAARTHYRKGERYVYGVDPDYENACKEAICAIEAIVLTLGGGSDLVKGGAKTCLGGRIPNPIAEMIIKLYAFRGDEPGVSDGSADVPEVNRLEAELLFNLAGGSRCLSATEAGQPLVLRQ
jgi:hypothetical protein